MKIYYSIRNSAWYCIASSPGSQEGGGERERRAWYTVLLMLQFLTTMTNFDSG